MALGWILIAPSLLLFPFVALARLLLCRRLVFDDSLYLEQYNGDTEKVQLSFDLNLKANGRIKRETGKIILNTNGAHVLNYRSDYFNNVPDSLSSYKRYSATSVCYLTTGLDGLDVVSEKETLDEKTQKFMEGYWQDPTLARQALQKCTKPRRTFQIMFVPLSSSITLKTTFFYSNTVVQVQRFRTVETPTFWA